METIIYVNQCRLYLEIEGEGEPLLFLHGNGEDSHYFSVSSHYSQNIINVFLWTAVLTVKVM